MVTDPSVQTPLEASPVSPIAFLLRQIAPSGTFRGAFRAQLSVHLSFPPTLLSAPSVSAA